MAESAKRKRSVRPLYLREWMEHARKTPSDMSNATGADKSLVSRWLAGTQPGEDRVKILAKLFGATRDQLHQAPPKAFTTFDPDRPEPDYDDGERGAGFVDGSVLFKGDIPGSAPETAARGGMGPGQIDARAAHVQSNGIATGHPVAAEWVIPPAFTRHGLGGRPDTIIIVPVIGHSMEPRLVEGDRVIVDVSQNAWVGDAMYAFDDGDVNLQVKTIKKVTSSFPAIYRIVSEATPAEEERLQADQFRIVGRVVGRISRP